MSTLQAPAGQGFSFVIQTNIPREDKENYQLILYTILFAISLWYAVFFGNFLALDFDSPDLIKSTTFWFLFLSGIKILVFGWTVFSVSTAYATDDSNYLWGSFFMMVGFGIYDFLLLLYLLWFLAVGCTHSICTGLLNPAAETVTDQYIVLVVTLAFSMALEFIILWPLVLLIQKADQEESKHDETDPTPYSPPTYPATEKSISKRREKTEKIRKEPDLPASVHDLLDASDNLDDNYNAFNLFLVSISAVYALYFGIFLALEFELRTGYYVSASARWWFTWAHIYKLPFLFFVLMANGRTRIARTTSMLDYAFTLLVISILYSVGYFIFFLTEIVPCDTRFCFGLSNNGGTFGQSSPAFVIFLFAQIIALILEIVSIYMIYRTRASIRLRNDVTLEAMDALHEGTPMAWVRDSLRRYGYVFVNSIESSLTAPDYSNSNCEFEEVARDYHHPRKNIISVMPYSKFQSMFLPGEEDQYANKML